MAAHSIPVRTIRPGDLLTGDGVPNLIDTAQKMNLVGELVGACDTSAPVYIGWGVRYLEDTMLAGHYRCAVVFGPREAVREKFIDVHRALGQHVRTMRNRTMELQNGTRIMFVYLDDAGACRGMHFHSVWIVGENYNRVYYDSEGHQFSSLEDRDSSERRIQNAVSGIQEVRSGYRGAVGAQYGQQIATGIRAAQEDASNLISARLDLLRQRVRDADRSMVQETNPLLPADITERERALQRELDFITQQLEERTQISVATTSTSPLQIGVDDRSSMTISLQPTDADGQPVGEPILQTLEVVSGQHGTFVVETSIAKPSEPIRFPEKRTFLKEDDE